MVPGGGTRLVSRWERQSQWEEASHEGEAESRGQTMPRPVAGGSGGLAYTKETHIVRKRGRLGQGLG